MPRHLIGSCSLTLTAATKKLSRAQFQAPDKSAVKFISASADDRCSSTTRSPTGNEWEILCFHFSFLNPRWEPLGTPMSVVLRCENKQVHCEIPRAIALYMWCPLLPSLLDGLHHYLNLVLLSVPTAPTVNEAVSGFTFPATQRERRILFWLGVVEANL